MTTKARAPQVTRPHMPGYGISTKKKGLLPWRWAEERLAKSREYYIATVRPDGRPHVMPVWGLWVKGAFYFSTGKTSRKGRNLQVNPNCVVCSAKPSESVVVEGRVEMIIDAGALKPLFAAYKKKYKMDVSGMGEPFYCVRPKVAFGLSEKKFVETATRWVWEP